MSEEMLDETNVEEMETDVSAEAPAKKGRKAKKEAEKKVATGPVCVICGKPLTDPKSVEKGVGSVCEHGGSVEERKARVEAHSADVAPEGWIKIGSAVQILRDHKAEWNISPMRIVRATGGDNLKAAPIDPIFQPVYVKGTRYLNPEVVGPKGREILLGMKREVTEKPVVLDAEGNPVPAKKKAKKEPKPEPVNTTAEDRIG